MTDAASEYDDPSDAFVVDLDLCRPVLRDLFECPTDNEGAYCNEVTATLRIDGVVVGNLTASLVRGGLISRDGLSVFQEMDNMSQELLELAEAIIRYDDNWYKQAFWEKTEAEGLDILYVSRLTIAEGFRGHQLGLALTQHVLRYCPHHVAVLKPFPLQHENARHGPKPEFKAFENILLNPAKTKLRKYYARLGFERFQRTPYMFRQAADGYDYIRFDLRGETLETLIETARGMRPPTGLTKVVDGTFVDELSVARAKRAKLALEQDVKNRFQRAVDEEDWELASIIARLMADRTSRSPQAD